MFIIISAPMYRCGTTLVQRLLNTTDECMIYGENNAILASLDAMIAQVVQATEKSNNEWKEFKKNKNCWSANINPSFGSIINTSIQFLTSLYRTNGYQNYGFKSLSMTEQHVKMITYLWGNDNIRIIYCIRPFEEAYSSYKEMYGWMSKEDLKCLYDKSIKVATMNHPSVLNVDYNSINHNTCKNILESVGCTYDHDIVESVLSSKLREEPNYVRK